MSCDGEESVSVINTNSKRIKDGNLRRFKDKMFGSKWPDCYAVLYQDSTFVWYDKRGDISAKGCVQLKQLAPYIVVGAFTDRLPNRPSLPDNGRVQNLLAIGTGSRGAKIHWFLFNSEDNLNDWMTQIVATLPPPPQPPPPPQMQQQQLMQPMVQPTPPRYTASIGPPPSYPQQQPPVVYAYQQQPATNTTVIVDRGYDHYNNGMGGFGTGLLVGGVAGYALGSYGHHGYGGYGYGYGYGGGGGFYSDNDTTVINNYNTTNVTDVDNTNNTFNETNNDYDNDYNTGGYDSYDNGYDNCGGGGDYGDYGGGGFDDGGGGGYDDY